jgi:sulfur carrier protein
MEGGSMIKLNNRDFPWEDGMTVESLMNQKKFTYSRIIVKVNGQHIEQENYARTVINDGDDVQMIHLLAGG